jgi:elongation factor 1-beta
MGFAVVTLKIMPASPEINLEELEIKVKEEINKFAGEGETKTEINPVAFGLNSLNIIFVMDETKGSPDPVAEIVDKFEEVNSAEISDVRRALG